MKDVYVEALRYDYCDARRTKNQEKSLEAVARKHGLTPEQVQRKLGIGSPQLKVKGAV